MSAAKTTAERQAAFRSRKAEQMAIEVRGLFACPDDHARIKAYVQRVNRERVRAMVAAKNKAL